MKREKGSALVVLIGLLVLIAGVVMMFISYANKAVFFETDIDKFDKTSQNTLSNYTLKVSEMFQVPEAYKDDLKNVIKATFEGRYGADGSKATMQWIQEQNLQFDSSLYKDLMVVMNSGRDEFKLSQDRKLEICADYTKFHATPVNKTILDVIGYPTSGVVDIKCRVVLDNQTKQTFETGIAEPLKLRK